MLELSALEQEALALSLRVAVVSVLVSLPFGLMVAWVLARREFFGKTLVNGLVHLPLVVPPVVVGYLLLLLLGREGPLGGFLYDVFGITVAFTWKGAAVAAGVMAFPLMVRAMRLSLELVDRRLEAAARTLGAGRFDVFLTVTLPLMSPGILAGAILAFARSLGEFGATITFVSNIPGETRTLPHRALLSGHPGAGRRRRRRSGWCWCPWLAGLRRARSRPRSLPAGCGARYSA